MAIDRVIVIGASAGGVHALIEVVRGLPPDLPAAVFTVLHLGSGRSALPEILSRAGSLPASHPSQGETIRPGRVYAAPPDHHLAIHDSTVRVLRGPRENGHRPAIDVLFRSAAQAYGRRVIGVVLTGNLDDGTAGLLAIKSRGGVAVVQDPADADYPSMPRSAVENVPVDHVLPLADLAPHLVRLAREPFEDVAEEVQEVDVKDEHLGESGEETGTPSGFTCPDCGGALWEWHDGGLVRFRCRTGHAFSPDSLVAAQSEALETALWAAVRTLEETAAISRRMAGRMRDSGLAGAETRYRERAKAAERHADVLRKILEKGEEAGGMGKLESDEAG